MSSKITQGGESKGSTKKSVQFSKQTADHTSELRGTSNSSISPAHEALRPRVKSSSTSPSSGQPQLSSLALREHALIAQLVLNIAGPRFPEKVRTHIYCSYMYVYLLLVVTGTCI